MKSVFSDAIEIKIKSKEAIRRRKEEEEERGGKSRRREEGWYGNMETVKDEEATERVIWGK